ncbi:MAG: phosphatidate cytidylyltransferase [Bryobacterales bacterium]|nr:phosphatidate cytidylyltransferase [Bryobacteraceae bacterium]MDW8355787.1 phosphatidate cytidylyltransferase [Bryobacterales bacterium]
MTRVWTALLLAPAVLAIALWGPGWLFLVLVAAVALLCFYEYAGIVAAHGIPPPGPAAYAAGLALLVVHGEELLLLTLLALVALILAARQSGLEDVLPAAAATSLGVLYVFGSLRFALELRAESPYWLVFALGLNWAGDTTAYYAGRAFGRHKLAPRLSPAKSWEGSLAGLAASLLFGVLFLGRFVPQVSWTERVVLSAAGNLAGQLGDLCESALKRGAHLKDSGRLLPGHGGWLDRLDSSLFALPMVYLLLRLL